MINGKRTSKHNAVTHGILADILLADDHMGESGETYRRMLLALQTSMRPVDNFEQLLVEKLAFLYIRLTRVYKADWQVVPKLFKKLEKSIKGVNTMDPDVMLDLRDDLIDGRRSATPELLIRYESNIERQINRTIDQFGRWRMLCPKTSNVPAEIEEQIESQGSKESVA
jgi:hypothetical protein